MNKYKKYNQKKVDKQEKTGNKILFSFIEFKKDLSFPENSVFRYCVFHGENNKFDKNIDTQDIQGCTFYGKLNKRKFKKGLKREVKI